MHAATRHVRSDEFGFASLGLRAADFLDPDVVIQLGYEPNRIDFLTKLTGVEFTEAYPARASITVNEIDVPLIDRASGQPPAARIAEVESLRRLWIEITGDPDLPIVRIVHRRRLGEPAIEPPR